MIRLYVGGDAGTVQGESMRPLVGHRCFTAAIRLKTRLDLSQTHGLLDSGAFTDKPEARLTPEQALDRQIAWETNARRFCHHPTWQVEALVSYDRLIDETWVSGERHKRRWTLKKADAAVQETIEAARYLADQREQLHPRKLVLSGQGVDASQYADCTSEILKYATPEDWFGFGGWCIIGRNKRMLSEFENTINLVIPMIAQVGIQHVHLFGVLWTPALGRLLWIADQHHITVSSDSGAPVTAVTWQDKKRSGVRCEHWLDNVNWWREHLSKLRESDDYRPPKKHTILRQLDLFDMEYVS